MAEAVADEGDQSLEAVRIDPHGCAELSDSEDSDGDGAPDAATFTFALPACRFTGFRGGTLEITGEITLSDPTPSVPTDRKIVAGEIHATLGDGSYISTTWSGCGQDPTRTFVPAS